MNDAWLPDGKAEGREESGNYLGSFEVNWNCILSDTLRYDTGGIICLEDKRA